jgi:hypothetical protein
MFDMMLTALEMYMDLHIQVRPPSPGSAPTTMMVYACCRSRMIRRSGTRQARFSRCGYSRGAQLWRSVFSLFPCVCTAVGFGQEAVLNLGNQAAERAPGSIHPLCAKGMLLLVGLPAAAVLLLSWYD